MLTIILIKTCQMLLALTLLVVIHEFGHYTFARLFGVRVDAFYIFFNPKFSLFKWRRPGKHTTWGIGWLPLGGYCKLNGMIDESFDTEHVAQEPQPYEFRAKPAWQRLLIMVGGVLFNILLAVLIYAGIAWAYGRDTLPAERATAGLEFSPVGHFAGYQDGDVIVSADGKQLDLLSRSFARDLVRARVVVVRRAGQDTTLVMPPDLVERILRDGRGFLSLRLPFVVDSILPHSPALLAGMQAGDRLLSIDRTPIYHIADATDYLAAHKGDSVRLLVLRGLATDSLQAQVDTAGRIGVMMRPIDKIYPIKHYSYNALQAIPEGATQAYQSISAYVGDLSLVFTRQGAKSVGGFASIGGMFPAQWDWHQFWLMTALLSIILAVANLLPIPLLDGAYILFLLYEIISRRKPSAAFLTYANMIGLVILLLLMLYANGNDVVRLLSGR